MSAVEKGAVVIVAIPACAWFWIWATCRILGIK